MYVCMYIYTVCICIYVYVTYIYVYITYIYVYIYICLLCIYILCIHIYNINIYTVEPKYIQPGYTWIHLGYFVWLFPTWKHPGTATAWAVEPLTERLVTNAAAGTVYSLPSMQCAGHGKQSEREAGSSISRNMLYLLVVLTILKNMLVNGTDYPIYYGQFQKCLKPPTS